MLIAGVFLHINFYNFPPLRNKKIPKGQLISFWWLNFSKKNNKDFDIFLPWKLKSGQTNKVKALSYSTMIIWAI